MIKLILAVAVITSSCFFGSIIDFSEHDLDGKENKILNSGFEEVDVDANPIPLGWTILNDLENTISTDTEIFNSGNRSLKISHPKKKISIISESFPINSEAIFFSRCFIKTNYKSNHAVNILFIAFNSEGKQVSKFNAKGYPKENWTEVVLTTGFFKPDAQFGRIVITFPNRADKVYWLDDVESFDVYKIQK